MVQIHCSVKEHSLTLPSSANRMSQFNNHYNFSHLGLLKVIGLYCSSCIATKIQQLMAKVIFCMCHNHHSDYNIPP